MARRSPGRPGSRSGHMHFRRPRRRRSTRGGRGDTSQRAAETGPVSDLLRYRTGRSGLARLPRGGLGHDKPGRGRPAAVGCLRRLSAAAPSGQIAGGRPIRRLRTDHGIGQAPTLSDGREAPPGPGGPYVIHTRSPLPGSARPCFITHRLFCFHPPPRRIRGGNQTENDNTAVGRNSGEARVLDPQPKRGPSGRGCRSCSRRSPCSYPNPVRGAAAAGAGIPRLDRRKPLPSTLGQLGRPKGRTRRSEPRPGIG